MAQSSRHCFPLPAAIQPPLNGRAVVVLHFHVSLTIDADADADADAGATTMAVRLSRECDGFQAIGCASAG